MIRVLLPAKMECTEDGCGNAVAVDLCLLASGGFGFKPSSALWQIAVPRNNPAGPFMCRCPKHAQVVESVGAPTGKLIADAH